MLIKYERILAYICPFCSSLSKSKISAFDFSGAGSKELYCSTAGCHEECGRITKRNNKYRINAECPICGDMHTYSADMTKFWTKPIISYKCPVSGINILFCGEAEEVNCAIEENTDYYSEIIPDFDDNSEENTILYEIIDCVHYLQSRNKISCVCGSENIAVQIINNNVVIICKKCKRVRVIETNEHNLAMLLNAEAVVIGS